MIVLLGLLAAAAPLPRPQPVVISGRVLGADERPLEGALVLAGRPGEAARCARTDARGAFRIEVADRRAVTVLAEAEEFAPTEVSGIHPGTPLTLRLTAGTSLTGLVRDARGAAVAGARVAVALERATLTSPAGSTLREASSDAMGAFRVPRLPAGPFAVEVQATGFQEVRWRRLPGDRPLDVVLTRAAWLAGQLGDERGKPIARAEVRMFAEAGGDPRRARADAAGRFGFPFGAREGPWRVVARGESTAPALSPPLTSSDTPLTLRLARGARVTGRVLDEAGRARPARVELLELDGVSSPALGELVRAEGGADGRFVLDRLPAGRHALLVTARGRPPQRVPVQVGRAADLEIGDVELAAGLTVEGQVLDEEGRPVAAAQVSAAHDDDDTVRTLSTETEADGRFRIAGLRSGEVRLRVEAAGFAPARVRAQAGVRPVEITLRPGGQLGGEVVDEADRPLESVTLEAEPVGGRPGIESLRRDLATPGGRLLLEDVAPGRYAVVLSAPERAAVILPSVEVVRGHTTDLGRVRLGDGLDLRVKVAASDGEPVPGASVRAVRGAGMSLEWSGAREGRTDLSGRLDLVGLSAGTYLVTASHPDHVSGESGPVELEPGAPAPEVRVVLGEGGRVEGTVRRRGVPLAGARVDVLAAGAGIGTISSTTTDGEGRFELERVRPGSAQAALMDATPGAAASLLARRLEVREGETTRVDLELREVLVQGQVTRGGSPLGGARVEIRKPEAAGLFAGDGPGAPAARRYHRALTRPDGRFELLVAEPGRHLARVEPADGGDLPAREVEVPDVDAFALVLDLPAEGVRLSGVVVDADSGAPLADAGVQASPLRHDGARAAHGRTGPDGSFALEVDPGPYRLRAGARDHQSRSRDLEVGDADLPGVRIELPAGRSLKGRVVDTTGAGVGGLEVMATAAGGGGYAMTAPDGGFEMEGLGAVPHALGTAARDGRFGFALATPTDDGAPLVLLPGGWVALEVVGPGDEPQPGLLATLAALDGVPAEFPELWGETDASGHLLRPVPAGRVELEVASRNLAGRVAVEVAAGAQVAARIRLQPAR